MRNIRLTIEYDGANYCGWQVQKRKGIRPSIQQTIEKALCTITQGKVRLIGSGRTDAGVHALGQVANFTTDSAISCEKLQKALHALLPGDIVVNGVRLADAGFHSRFKARSKVYRYTVVNRTLPSVFLRSTSYFYSFPLDIKLMQKQARALLGRRDFSAFCASGSSAKSPVRTIKKIEIRKAGDLVSVTIEADGFLYNMARNIVGTLLEVGRGRFPPGSLKKILASGDRRRAGPTAPAKGLCLVEVKY